MIMRKIPERSESSQRGPRQDSAGVTMTRPVLLLFFIAFLAAGCSAITARDSAGPGARIERQDRVTEGSGAAPADGKGREQKKDAK